MEDVKKSDVYGSVSSILKVIVISLDFHSVFCI